MPSFINGPLEIATVGGTGVVNFGDSAVLSPKTATKTFAGSGGFSTGGVILTIDGLNGTNVIDSNFMDQPAMKNN